MNLSKYDIETLLVKAKHYLSDYKGFKDALNFIPESSVLGSLGVKASMTMSAKKYERIKAEIFRRNPNLEIRKALIGLETSYNYKEV